MFTCSSLTRRIPRTGGPIGALGKTPAVERGKIAGNKRVQVADCTQDGEGSARKTQNLFGRAPRSGHAPSALDLLLDLEGWDPHEALCVREPIHYAGTSVIAAVAFRRREPLGPRGSWYDPAVAAQREIIFRPSENEALMVPPRAARRALTPCSPRPPSGPDPPCLTNNPPNQAQVVLDLVVREVAVSSFASAKERISPPTSAEAV